MHGKAAAEAPGRGRKRPVFTGWIAGAHVLALWTFAVAQPILDLIGRQPDFLVAQRLTGAPLVALAIGGAMGVPALLSLPLLVPRLGTGLPARCWADGVRALLAGTLFLQLLHSLPAAAALALSAIGGVVAALCLNCYRGFSNLVAVSAIAVVVSPLVFLLRPGVRGLAANAASGSAGQFEPDAVIAASPALNTDAPIVLVVFDELPTSSLQRSDGSIDARRYPSFSALAQGADWYARAVTVGLQTSKAVPALLTGTWPQAETTAHYTDHPSNLLSWLANRGGYRVVSRETVTQLCPAAICGQTQPNPRRQLRRAVDDLSVVYAHLLLPPALRTSLPSVDHAWTGFRTDRSVPEIDRGPAGGGVLDQDVPRVVEDFLRRIDEGTGRPTLYYVHLNLPHRPWKYLPSGREYTPVGTPVSPPGFEGRTLPRDERRTVHGLQRHLLQVGYADRVLGQILDRLKRAGIHDRALIVVAADHGHSFRPGEPRRSPTSANVEDVLEVPLFVKRPGQVKGAVFDHLVQTIDVVPTIAAEIGAQLPWPVDGKPLSDRSRREIRVCCFRDGDAARRFRTDAVRRQETLDRMDRLFGDRVTTERTDPDRVSVAGRQAARSTDSLEHPFRGVFTAGPRPDLLGRPANGLVRVDAAGKDPIAGVRAVIEGRSTYRNVRPENGFVPSLVAGRTEPSVADGTQLAISVDGAVRATAETFSDRKGSRFAALIEERHLTAGSHKIGVYAIRGGGAPGDPVRTVLIPLSSSGNAARLAVEAGSLRGVNLGDDQYLERADHLFQGDVEAQATGFRGRLLSRPGEKLLGPDEFFVFGGADLLYRGLDDPSRRRVQMRADDREQMLFRVFLPAALLNEEPLRLLARSGRRIQQLYPPGPLGTFELSHDAEGRQVLLWHPGNTPDALPERIPVQPQSADGVIGYFRVEGARRANASIHGWAADLADPGSPLEVVAFLHGSQFWAGAAKLERENVADRFGREHLHSGFVGKVRTVDGLDAQAAAAVATTIRREGFAAYALSPRGGATRLRFLYGPLEEENGEEILPISDGRRLRVLPTGGGFSGSVDLVVRPAQTTRIEGWAADLDRSEPAQQIVVYRDGQHWSVLGVDRERPDVAEHHDDPGLLRTGFRGTVRGAPEPASFAERHRVFALMSSGAAVELPVLAPTAETNS